MDYSAIFNQRLNGLKREGNYRFFAELERPAGLNPRACGTAPAARERS